VQGNFREAVPPESVLISPENPVKGFLYSVVSKLLMKGWSVNYRRYIGASTAIYGRSPDFIGANKAADESDTDTFRMESVSISPENPDEFKGWQKIKIPLEK